MEYEDNRVFWNEVTAKSLEHNTTAVFYIIKRISWVISGTGKNWTFQAFKVPKQSNFHSENMKNSLPRTKAEHFRWKRTKKINLQLWKHSSAAGRTNNVKYNSFILLILTLHFNDYLRRTQAIHLCSTVQRRTKNSRQNANSLSNSIDVERCVTRDVMCHTKNR